MYEEVKEVKKRIAPMFLFFTAVALFFVINISYGQDFGQGGQERPSMGDKGQGQNLSKDIQELVDAEKSAATTAQNSQERYRKLMSVIVSMIRSGRSVDNILPRDEGQKLDSLIKAGNFEEAAQKVHEVILKLETVGAGEPKGGSRQAPGQNTMQRPESNTGSFLSSVPLAHIDIHQMANKNNFGNILKLMNPAIDSANRRLYFGGSKSTLIGVLDLDRDELIETFDIGIPCGFLIADPSSADIYSLEIGGNNKVHRIDVKQKKAVEVSSLPSHISLPKKNEPKTYKGLYYTDTGYPFEAGYLQEENAAYGVIVITDSKGRQIGKIEHGPDALYFAIDAKTGKLYATNTGDASISVFDLNNHNKKIKDIDVGTSVDEIELDQKNGAFYVRNRLGGSTVYYYDPAAKSIFTIPNENVAGREGIGMWPTQIIYDEGKLYVLSHYAGRIDAINAQTRKLTGSIQLKLSYKPRTDGISTLAMDRTRKMLYAGFPELGEVAITDAKTMKFVKILKLANYDTKKIGPGRIVLAVDEKLNKLFVYLSKEKMLDVFNLGTYSLEREISLNIGRTERLLTSNAEKGVLYAGNRILDAVTLDERERFSKGEKVIAFDNAKNNVYLVGKTLLGRGKTIERIYQFEGTTLKKEWTLSPVMSIPSSFAFDFANNRFYTGYFEAAAVEAFDLTAGNNPSSESPGSPNEGAGLQQPQGSPISSGQGRSPGGVKGRCGDGICQAIEKQKGVCPEDCSQGTEPQQ